jgi:hypothetical protein
MVSSRSSKAIQIGQAVQLDKFHTTVPKDIFIFFFDFAKIYDRPGIYRTYMTTVMAHGV